MKSCPLTGVDSEKVLLCERYNSWTVCLGCPAFIVFETIDCWPDQDSDAFLAWVREAWAKEGAKHNGVCTWMLDDEDANAWATTCGDMYQLMADGPTENNMRYCPFCGLPLVEAEGQDEVAPAAHDDP